MAKIAHIGMKFIAHCTTYAPSGTARPVCKLRPNLAPSSCILSWQNNELSVQNPFSKLWIMGNVLEDTRTDWVKRQSSWVRFSIRKRAKEKKYIICVCTNSRSDKKENLYSNISWICLTFLRHVSYIYLRTYWIKTRTFRGRRIK